MTELEFRPDFAEVRERWRQFHRGTNRRPLIHTIIPKTGTEPVPCPSSLRCAFEDVDLVAEEVLGWAASHEFLGESIPRFQVNFTAGHLAPLLGAKLKWNEASPDTTWIEPCLPSLADHDIRFDPSNEWWEKTIDSIHRLRRHLDGRVLVFGPRLVGGLDCLSAMRGTQNLLMDLVDSPDDVQCALSRIDAAVEEIQSLLALEFDIETYGSVNRFGIHHDGLIEAPQSDFSAMIGPDMFKEFDIPSMRRELKQVDDATYHLDGPNALRHVNAICTLEKVSVIQWVPGVNIPSTADDWRLLYRQIDSLGKGQVYNAVSVTQDNILSLWNELSSSKQFFHLKVQSRDEFFRFIDKLEALEKPCEQDTFRSV